jgi:hypothetical protein
MFGRVLAVSAAAILPALTVVAPASSATVLSGVTVAIGIITSPSEAPISGEKLDLYAWPPDAVLKVMKPGQAVPRKLLATATTNSSGHYELQVPQARLANAAVTTGYVNLEIDSADGISFLTYQASSDPQSGGPSGLATVNLGGRRSSAINCGHYPNGTAYTFQGFQFQRNRAPAWAVVGQGYIIKQRNTRNDTVSFNYTKGSSHSQNSALGIGVSGTGFNAGYTTDGSHMSTASSAEGYAAEHRNTWFRTEFNTGQYRGVCTGLPGTNVHPVKQKNCPRTFGPFNDPVHKCIWMIHSTGWSGGQTTQHPKSAPTTPRSDCRKHEAGDRYDGDHGSAIEWSQGFELGAALNIKGIDGKASFNSTTHTGYDTNAVMLYRFHHTGYLCGTNGTEATAAIIVQRANLP